MARILVLTASMGAGHNGVGSEIAGRLRGLGHDVDVVDMLTLYPWRLGAALRASYGAMLRITPWIYELIYQTFFVGRGPAGANVSPAVWLAMPRLRRTLSERPPDAVVSTFHLASLAVGRLRSRGELTVPSMVFITEAAAHNLWCGPGTDLYLCAYPQQAEQLRKELGADACATGPVVRSEFLRCRDSDAAVPLSDTDRKVVLVSTGSWGIGRPDRVIAALFGTGHYLPVVLCGHNRRLARRLRGRSDCVALGWVANLADLMQSASALVENAGGGLTCWEAFAAGVPVVSFDPLPGHGRAGAVQLADAGLTRLAADEAHLTAFLDEVTAVVSPTRERLRQATAALFQQDAAQVIVAQMRTFRRSSHEPAAGSGGPSE